MIVGDLVDARVAEIRTGPFGTQLKASDYVEVGRPVLNVRNVGFGDVRSEKLEFIDEPTADRLSGHLLENGDIVFGRKGAVERHAFIRDNFVGALQGSDCIRLRLSANAPIRAHFASFALRTTEHQAWMQAFCSHGATMASLNQDIVRQIRLPDLPLPAQDAVIDVLGSIDDLIENNRRRVEVLEEMARAIYREWFVRFRYPGHEDVPLIESPLGSIPEGWDHMIVSDAADPVTRGVTPKYADDGAWTVINQKCIRDAHLSLEKARRQERAVSVAKQVRKGDVLINSTGVGTLGRVALCLIEHPSLTVDAHVTIVRPRLSYANPWFGLGLVGRQAEFERLGTGSTGQTELSRSDIGAMTMLVPAESIRSKFAVAVSPLLDHANALRDRSRSVAALRDLLLPKLVTGKIDVWHLDLDALTEAAPA